MPHLETTKKVLGDALKELMETKPFHKITVSDLTERCSLNRQTFYYHFQDIYDLLGWIYKTEAVESIAGYKSYETWVDGFLRVFTYIRNNKAFCNNTFHSVGRDHLETFLYDVTYELVIGVVKEVAKGAAVKEDDEAFIANFYTIAFVGLVVQWLRQGMKEDPALIVKKLSVIVEGNFKKALFKFNENDK